MDEDLGALSRPALAIRAGFVAYEDHIPDFAKVGMRPGLSAVRSELEMPHARTAMISNGADGGLAG